MSGFSDTQQKVLERCYAELGEHFDGVMICVLTECGENQPQEAVRSYYKGGRIQAIGLLVEAQHRILNLAGDDPGP